MDKKELRFEDFLFDVNPAYHEFVNQTNDLLMQNDCKLKMELAKSGYVVSYNHPNTKRVIINFVFRKSGLCMRLYADHVNQYVDFIETLPDDMSKAIAKSPVCKRLINPDACNARCPMGYDFTMKGTHHQKCRYNCFLFAVNEASIPFLQTFLTNELGERAS